MATLDAQDVRNTVSDLASTAADATSSLASAVGDALTTTVLPKVADAGTSLASAATSAAGTLADAGSSLASAAADKAEDVDTEQLKRWWPVAAVVALLVGLGLVHRRKQRNAAEDDSETED
jgi:hypothetical protein